MKILILLVRTKVYWSGVGGPVIIVRTVYGKQVRMTTQNENFMQSGYLQVSCLVFVTLFGIQYSHRHTMINHCNRHITLLSDTDISFGLFNLFTYFLVHFR